MKKLFVVLIAVMIVSQAWGQLKFGIQGGVNLANVLAKDDNDTYSKDYKMNLGFNAGPIAELGFGDIIAIKTGLIVNTKGSKEEGTESGYAYTMKYNLIYLDLPVLLKAGFSAGPVKIFADAGPYIGMGLTGKYKLEVPDFAAANETKTVKWGSGDQNDLKRLDYGLSFGAGFGFGPIEVGAQYEYGLANVSAYDQSGANFKINNRLLSFSVAYKFGL